MPTEPRTASAHAAPDDHAIAVTAQIDQLYRSERDRLLRIAVLLVGDRGAAEDVVHDAFAALHKRWATLTDPTAAAGYLTVSVANTARSALRRRRVALRHLRVGEPDSTAAADAALLLGDEHRAVIAAVRRLPKRQQQVIILRYWADLTEQQIAEAMGISRGTVKSNAARGLATVHKHLEAQA